MPSLEARSTMSAKAANVFLYRIFGGAKADIFISLMRKPLLIPRSAYRRLKVEKIKQ